MSFGEFQVLLQGLPIARCDVQPASPTGAQAKGGRGQFQVRQGDSTVSLFAFCGMGDDDVRRFMANGVYPRFPVVHGTIYYPPEKDWGTPF